MNKLASLAIYLALMAKAHSAEPLSFGEFEFSKYMASNMPAYRDFEGGNASYRLDFTLQYALVDSGRLWVKLGFDAITGPTYFTQGSGHAECELRLTAALALFGYHRSEHAFDRSVDLNGPRFLSDNRLGFRYKFKLN